MKQLYTLIFVLFIMQMATAQVTEQEFQALKALYRATDGDNWTNRTGWENINTTATKDSVTSDWYGILNIYEGHVKVLDLRNNNLTGQIPPEIGEFTELVTLYLGNNNLSGTLPEEIGNLSNLFNFSVFKNQLTGGLPESFEGLSKIVEIDISTNQFNTEFPKLHIPSLELFHIYLNDFTGEIPPVKYYYPNIQNLEVSRNNFTGSITSVFDSLSELGNLSFQENGFTGGLPILSGCMKISDINAERCGLTGTIPESFNQLENFKKLNLKSNNLTGPVPELLLNRVERFYIDYNYFTFEAIEPIATHTPEISWTGYRNNKKYPLNQDNLSVEKDSELLLDAKELMVHNPGGNNNRYKWYHNNELVYSGNSPAYVVGSAQAANAGTYYVEITNINVPDHTITTNNIQVSVTGTNEAPTDINLSNTIIDETFNGIVGTLSATDLNEGDVFEFSLVEGDGTNDANNRGFSIDGDKLYAHPGQYLDFEISPVCRIYLSVSDGNGGLFSKAIEIELNNVDEAPGWGDNSWSFNIDENLAPGEEIATFAASDPEGSAVEFVFETGNVNNAFAFDGNRLIVSENDALDYDIQNAYSLVVKLSDGVNVSETRTIEITLNKIDETPVVSDFTFTVDENSPAGTLVGTIEASDPDDDVLSFEITGGNEAGFFELDNENLVLSSQADIDYETKNEYLLQVTVSDGVSDVVSALTVLVNDVGELTGNSIISFQIEGLNAAAFIDTLNHTIEVDVNGSNTNEFVALFTLSPGAQANRQSGCVLIANQPETIEVTSETGEMQQWVVTLSKQVTSPDFKNFSVNVFPNPVCRQLSICSANSNGTFKLRALNGQILISGKLAEGKAVVDVASLSPGVYIVEVQSDKGIQTSKIIKK